LTSFDIEEDVVDYLLNEAHPRLR